MSDLINDLQTLASKMKMAMLNEGATKPQSDAAPMVQVVESAAAEILRLLAELADAKRAGWIAGRDAALSAAIQAGFRRGDIGTLDAALHAISNMEPPA